jgi:hypothetical protein
MLSNRAGINLSRQEGQAVRQSIGPSQPFSSCRRPLRLNCGKLGLDTEPYIVVATSLALGLRCVGTSSRQIWT